MIRSFALATLAFCIILLAGCAAQGPGDIAAKACHASVQEQLGIRPFQLDLGVLAASMADDGRGGHLLTAPVVVDAGLADQATQQVECTVRLAADQRSAEVLLVRFQW